MNIRNPELLVNTTETVAQKDSPRTVIPKNSKYHYISSATKAIYLPGGAHISRLQGTFKAEEDGSISIRDLGSNCIELEDQNGEPVETEWGKPTKLETGMYADLGAVALEVVDGGGNGTPAKLVMSFKATDRYDRVNENYYCFECKYNKENPENKWEIKQADVPVTGFKQYLKDNAKDISIDLIDNLVPGAKIGKKILGRLYQTWNQGIFKLNRI